MIKCPGAKPRSTERRRSKLRSIRPAPISNSSASAASVVTNTDRSLERDVVRAASPNASRRSRRDPAIAGAVPAIVPAMMQVTSVTPSTMRST